MPIITVQVIKGVVLTSDEQKRELLKKMTDAFISVVGDVALDEGKANYLFAVMRLPVSAPVLLFNGRDGEWLAEVAEAGKRRGILRCIAQLRELEMPPDLWLLFVPIRKERTAFLVEKAVELGVRRLVPVSTRFMSAEKIRIDKERAHAVEAAEQCGATYVPEVAEQRPLEKLLEEWHHG